MLFAGGVFSCVVVALSVVSVKFSMAVACMPVIFVVLSNPVGRAAAIVAGYLLVFLSSQAVSPPKIVIFAGLAFLFFLGFKTRAIPTELRRKIRSLTVFSFATLLVSLFVSLVNDTPPQEWIRDALPYVLLALAPFVGIEIGTRLREKQIDSIIRVATILSALFTFLYWANVRGTVDTSLGRVGLASYLLPFAGVCYGLVRQRVRVPTLSWTIAIAFALFVLILTGTRTILLSIPACAFCLRTPRLRTEIHNSRKLLARALLILVAVTSLNHLAHPDWSRIVNRFSQISNKDLLTRDQSALDRKRQTVAAFSLFRENLAFGVGPGKRIASFSSSATGQKSYNLDSPIGVLADFGLLAPLLYLSLGLAIYRACRQNPVSARAAMAFFVLIGFNSLLLSPLEDKGGSLAVLLIVASSCSRFQGRLPISGTAEPPKHFSEWKGWRHRLAWGESAPDFRGTDSEACEATNLSRRSLARLYDTTQRATDDGRLLEARYDASVTDRGWTFALNIGKRIFG